LHYTHAHAQHFRKLLGALLTRRNITVATAHREADTAGCGSDLFVGSRPSIAPDRFSRGSSLATAIVNPFLRASTTARGPHETVATPTLPPCDRDRRAVPCWHTGRGDAGGDAHHRAALHARRAVARPRRGREHHHALIPPLRAARRAAQADAGSGIGAEPGPIVVHVQRPAH